MTDPRPVTFVSARNWPEEWLEELRQAAPGSRVIQSKGFEGAPLDEIEAVYGGVGRDLFPKMRKLRWIQTSSAGVEGALYPELIASPVVLTNCRGLFSIFIAELAMAHLLALTSQVFAAAVRPDRRTWLYKPLRAVELYGMTAVVVGLGNIGSEVADRCLGFRMRVIGVDPVRKAAAGVTLVRPERIDEVLPLAEVVFITAPATTARKLFDRARLFSLKKGAFLINSSRGPVVDTDALLEALRSGHLAGAGLDAVDPEPLPPDHPFWEMTNVSITPHIGGNTDTIDRRRMLFAKENLWRFVRGIPLLNVVNKQRGF